MNEKCLLEGQCNDLAGLSCQEGFCKCAKSSYWKNSKCGNLDFYIGFFFKYCNWFYMLIEKANSQNQKCLSDEECDATKNLVCKDGLCQCKDASLYWNEESASCCKKYL